MFLLKTHSIIIIIFVEYGNNQQYSNADESQMLVVPIGRRRETAINPRIRQSDRQQKKHRKKDAKTLNDTRKEHGERPKMR